MQRRAAKKTLAFTWYPASEYQPH